MTRIAFSWYGLPQYAARQIRKAIDLLGEDCAVIGSRPSVPVKGMEEALGQPIHWVDANIPVSWAALQLHVPKVFFQSGWAYPAFCALGAEVKRTGGRVIGLSDANWRGDFRQLILGAAAFRLIYRRHFDAVMVPGVQGGQLMRWFGMPKESIRCGMYGAEPSLFGNPSDLNDRLPIFLYAGQYIERKQVLCLIHAFQRFSDLHSGWTLQLCGSGPQRDLIPKHSNIEVFDFLQPEELPKLYAGARFFVLPSLVEAWGLVVHEAALSGCALILSDRIGSADDLATTKNAIRFRAGSENGLAKALCEAANRDAQWLTAAGLESRRLARQFGPDRFAREATTLVEALSAPGAR